MSLKELATYKYTGEAYCLAPRDVKKGGRLVLYYVVLNVLH